MDKYDNLVCLHFDEKTGKSLFSATQLSTQRPIHLEFILISESCGVAECTQAADNHYAVSDHPAVRTLLDGFPYTSPEGYEYYVLGLEPCQFTLSEMMGRQKNAGERLEEVYMWRLLKECVKALRFAQEKVRDRQGVCHRDINPDTIFVGEDGKARVGGFQCSMKVNNPQDFSSCIAGNPRYLSPELRQFLIPQSRTSSPLHVLHNPFQSDLFSLGYTFLVLSLLKDTNCGRVLNGIGANIANEVARLTGYSPAWKSAIKSMMDPDTDIRPDFITVFDTVHIPSEVEPEQTAQCVTGEHRNNLGEDRVGLGCGHEFCSKTCLCEFVYKETKGYGKGLEEVLCPGCGEKIGETTILDAFGGSSEFESQRSLLVQGCSVCNREAYTRKRFLCSHRICDLDFHRIQKPRACPYPGCGSAQDPDFKKENCLIF